MAIEMAVYISEQCDPLYAEPRRFPLSPSRSLLDFMSSAQEMQGIKRSERGGIHGHPRPSVLVHVLDERSKHHTIDAKSTQMSRLGRVGCAGDTTTLSVVPTTS